jgi:glucose/arabinose dehydrogenase/PKD repeat protein
LSPFAARLYGPSAARHVVAWRALIACAAALCVAVLAAPAGATTLPPGFQESVAFPGLDTPTAIEFAPNGRVFVAEKSGIVKTYSSAADTTATQVADLRTQVHNYWDRGLLGLAVDPNFPTEPYVYLFYAYDAPPGGTAPTWGIAGQTTDGCPDPPDGPGGNEDGCVVSGRISRLQIAGEVQSGPEQVLIPTVGCFQYPSHIGGGLDFGADGYLYYSGGDGAAWHFADYGQKGQPLNPCGDPPGGVGAALTPPTAEGGRLRAQDVRSAGDPTGLNGALIRIDPDSGAAAPGNPSFSSSDPNTRRIVAYGLRNSFRMAIRPGTNEIYMGDPGGQGLAGYEEINRVPDPLSTPVRNFGWPCYEGGYDNGASVNKKYPAYDQLDLNLCETLYTEGSALPPWWAYKHAVPVVNGETCTNTSHATSGLAFAPASGNFPPAYAGAFFFADYARDCIWMMQAGPGGVPNPATVQNFAQSSPTPVDLEFGPTGELYYADITGGAIKKISFTTAGNQQPTALAEATPQGGAVPLDVQFDGTGSTDPDLGDTLTYKWDLDGDGQLDDSVAAQPSFTYTTAGVYTVTLEVTDTGGASDTDTITINAGSGPPTASIDAPVATTTWRVGQAITFSGSATDPDDGPLPASALDWSLILHHCSTPTECHEHHIQDYENTAGGSFAAPDHEYPSYLELRLTATDSNGNPDTKSLRLDPQTSTITVNTSPAGLDVVIGDETGPGPIQHEAIVGSSNTVSAPSPQAFNNRSYAFYSWTDGLPRTHTLIGPAVDTTYTASYAPIVPGTQTLTFSPDADAYVEEANPGTNFGTATFLRTDAGGNPDVDSYLRFAVAGIQGKVTGAKLRLFSTSNTIDGPAAYPTSNTWTENGITWGNKPAPTGTALADTGAVSTGAWVEWDVGAFVTGPGTYSFQMHQAVSDGVNFNSRESTNTTRRPELVLTVANDAYPRPKGAGPFRVPFVPAYNACTAANRTHGPPLEHPSCNPPTQTSGNLTVGTPDANGATANSVGFLRYQVVPGDTGTPTDEADVPFEFMLSDVRVAGTLFDYSGELQARASIRMTDRLNGTAGADTATVQDLSLPATIPCAVTADVNVGAACNLTTSLDALTPGVVRESARAVWALEQVDVLDGGTDGDADTPPNQVFARQGIFIP